MCYARSSQLFPSRKAHIAIDGDTFPPSQADALPQTPLSQGHGAPQSPTPGAPTAAQGQGGPPGRTPGMLPAGISGQSWW